MKQENDKNEMPFKEHLKELKNRIMICVIFFIGVFIANYLYAEPILMGLVGKAEEIGYKLVYIAPQEILLLELKLSGILSLCITAPVILYHIIRFVLPAYKKPMRLAILAIAIILCFFVGTLFAYYALIPFVYTTLYNIGLSTGIAAQVTISNYTSLFLTFLLCMGVIFEMPLICSALSFFGILTSKAMKKAFKPMIVIIFIVSAFITPPDIFSQCIVAIPMIALYIVSMGLSKLFNRNKGNN